MFIDSHCHLDKLDLKDYNQSFDAMLMAAKAQQVAKMLCVNIDLANFADMYQLIANYPQIDASMGVHPLHVKSVDNVASVEQLITLASTHEKVVAIGETGLDYFYDVESKAVQQQSFIHHLQAANTLQLPVIVHTREARADTIELIAAHSGKSAGVLHCFTESLAMAEQAIELGYKISISGIVTFKNATDLQNVVKQLPLEHLLIETDSPYLAPIPYRGKQNQPKYVVEVAQCVAQLKGVSVAEVAKVTSENYYSLFSKSTITTLN
jgi:TatD DNase family protein